MIDPKYVNREFIALAVQLIVLSIFLILWITSDVEMGDLEFMIGIIAHIALMVVVVSFRVRTIRRYYNTGRDS